MYGKMKKNDWTVGKFGIRPAGDSDKCFYCGKYIGEQHKEDCVIRNRTVVVEMTMKLVLAVPESWDEELINFRYNEGTWCASNIIDEIERLDKVLGCICGITKFNYIGEATAMDEDKFKIYAEELPN